MNNNIFPNAKWICSLEFSKEQPINLLGKENKVAKPELPDDFKNVHMLVRKFFNINSINGDYRIRITADDYYKLYINGKYVAQGPAQGYSFSYYWNEIDITDFLICGENEIFVDVYYQGLLNRAYNSADRRMGMVAEVYQGEECILFTDKSWKYVVSKAYSISHTIGYDTMFAENYNSCWKPCDWKDSEEVTPDYIFNKESTKVLQVYSKKPREETLLENGGILYDFGQEITATLQINAEGKKGDKIRILCGEELDESELKVRYNMRCNCLYEEYWILDEGKNQLNQYDYKAFRYVVLIPEGNVNIHSINAKVQHYPFDDDYCILETDNEILKSVWEICKNGVKFGSQEMYVDCPSREKGQYAGDLTVSSSAHVILTGDYSLLKKAIDNQIQSSRICKGLMAVTPGHYMQEIADYSLQFPILALRYYKYSKDKDYLRECLKVCEGIIAHFRQFENKDGLLENVSDKWNLVDWPKNLRDDYDFGLENPLQNGMHNVINAFYIGCVMQTEEIRSILGLPICKKSDQLIEAFNSAFYNKNTGLYVDSMDSSHSSLHANVIPAFYGICSFDKMNKIADFIMDKGLCCGVYMAYFVLKALCRMERYQDAYSLIINESEHSWYNMVREGATTCFEAWGKNQKWNTSLCHPWASAPISVLVEDIIPNCDNVGKIVYSYGK